MRARRRRWVAPVAAALLVGVLAGCQSTLSSVRSPEQAAKLQQEIGAKIVNRFQDLVAERELAYRIVRAKFEVLPGRRLAWVMGLTGKSKGFRMGFSSSIRTMRPILRLYRDAIGPELKRMDAVALFLLVFDDPEQVLMEMEPDELRRYANGDLSDDEVFAVMSVIKRAPGGSPAPTAGTP